MIRKGERGDVCNYAATLFSAFCSWLRRASRSVCGMCVEKANRGYTGRLTVT